MSIRFCTGRGCPAKENCYRYNSMPKTVKYWRQGQPSGCQEFLPLVPAKEINPIVNSR